MNALLEVQDLEAGYGASQVLFGMSLAVDAGEVATLLGRNGMGKTTTVKSLLGFVKPRSGSIRFRGERIDGLSSDRIARMGIAVVPEGRHIFPNLSVEENLKAFAANRNARANPWTLDRIHGLFPRLLQRRSNMGGQLSGGEQQMLAIGRALMTIPDLLILDEATEGLAPLVREEIWRCLATLRGQGQTILVIDKYVKRLETGRQAHDRGTGRRGMGRNVATAGRGTLPLASLHRRLNRLQQEYFPASNSICRQHVAVAAQLQMQRWPELGSHGAFTGEGTGHRRRGVNSRRPPASPY